MSRIPGGLWKNLLAVQIYGANTGVGKTVLSTLLAAHFAVRKGPVKWNVDYIKPVSTGPEDESDEIYVKRYANAFVKTLFKYDDAVSPHVAARRRGTFLAGDGVLRQRLYKALQDGASKHSKDASDMAFSMVETAGGVLSPGPSGTPQADIFRPMRLPAVLVGDHRLGGIAATISAAESLLIRGYDIDAVVCFDDGGKYKNAKYLQEYFAKLKIHTCTPPWIPNLENCSKDVEKELMKEYYDRYSGEGDMYQLGKQLIDKHTERLRDVDQMAQQTQDVIWHPFTQHKSIKKADDILVFDSAYDDYFQAKHTPESLKSLQDKRTPVLHPAFDGSASWWTQGLGHGNPRLSLAAAYAAGRYGHVMFAGATHQPALTLAQRLLAGLDNPRLSKVFYTDNGSTAVEVGIKMALRAACKRYDWDGSTEEVGVLGLKGSYHGDTIGAMDASEPCVYNKKVDWYRGRGYWFDFPVVKMKEGRWLVEPPAGMDEDFGAPQHFENLEAIFDFDARGSSARYEEYIRKTLDRLVKTEGKKFGALVMEPIILGAGGMLFVDPLFQRTLVQVIRSYTFSPSTTPIPEEDTTTWRGLPVLFDEVFTGLYRLGRFSAASFLDTHPDISVHAKLLTGGLLPLSATLASDSIFSAFYSDNKSDALLHGHSYTAHPVGCHVANTSLEMMDHLSKAQQWSSYRQSWSPTPTPEASESEASPEPGTWSMWSKDTVTTLSHHPRVDSVIALGSVLAISLKDGEGAGYTSNAAAGLRDALLNDIGDKGVSVHSRVLGNVIYFMASMTSRDISLGEVEKAVLEKLGKGTAGAR